MRLDVKTEQDLLLGVAQGDEKAFRKLVDAFWWPVFYNTLTLTKNTDTAQEFTQDVFLKIWQQKHLLPDVKDFLSYVFIVGKHYVISAMRKKIMATDTTIPDYLEEKRNLPELELEYKETWKILLKIIDMMPKKQQQVFRMSRIDGLSNKEIAEATGLSIAAVKWHIVAGLNAIRIYLAAQNIDGWLILLTSVACLLH
jgi:RNA polymerase sigma-70 factor (ECF subfamily)